ncbi:hypothetical protein KC722_00765 [Candidatus Kaiserbacteria bacterium]|nr:hypothetical protein [Candidatus Kaiserbacteria bacterium]MCB9811494.1 hypothetical protein [Candidatus Nomurabacteria bacterium]
MGQQTLQKLRTFQADFARLRSNLDESLPEAKPAPKKEPLQEEPLRSDHLIKSAPVTPKAVPPKPAPILAPSLVPEKLPQAKTPTPEPLVTPIHDVTPPAKPEKLESKMATPAFDMDKPILQRDRRSLLTNNKTLNVSHIEDMGVEEGSIITDTKRHKQHLLPAIWHSFTRWFGEQKEKLAQLQTSEPLVTPATERRETVRTAAKRSTLAPRDDFATVAKRMGDVQRSERPTELTVKTENSVESVHWAYAEEETDGAEAETEALAHPAQEQVIKELEVVSSPHRAIYNRLPEKPLVVKPVMQPDERLPDQSLEPVADIPKTKDQALEEELVEEPAESAKQLQEPVVAPLPEIESVSEPVPPAVEPEEESAFSRDEEDISQEAEEEVLLESAPEPIPALDLRPQAAVLAEAPQQNFKPLLPSRTVIIAVSVLATLLGITTAYTLLGKRDSAVVIVNTSTADHLIRADEVAEVDLGSDRVTFLETIKSTRPSSIHTITLIEPSVSVQDATVVASTDELLSLLEPHAPSGFLRNITAMDMGLYGQETPFIIMKVTSFDTALSGMLEWEQSMSADLSPLFGSPVTGTFSADARTNTQTVAPHFVDTVVNNMDVRLLRDVFNKERIIYSFIDQQTILLTTTPEALEAITLYLR